MSANRLEVSIRQYQHAMGLFLNDDDLEELLRRIRIPNIAEKLDLPLMLEIAGSLSGSLAIMQSLRASLTQSVIAAERKQYDATERREDTQ